MNRSLFVSLCASLTVATASAAPTPPARHAIVAAFERFYSTTTADAVAGGRLLLGELNCTSCHRVDASWNDRITPKQAPRLTDVGDRVRPEFLRALLNDPQHAKPGTTMPDVLARRSQADRRRAVEALVHFLAATATDGPSDSFVDRAAVKRGEQLFHDVGCAACHGSRRPDGKPIPFAVPLPALHEKYTRSSLADFLRDPHKVRPSGRMPSLNLSEQDASDLAAYFLKDVVGAPNVRYAYYEGSWERLPNFAALRPTASGEAVGFDLDVARRTSHFGLRFEGYFQLADEGNCVIRLGSDDGSRLLIDGTPIVVNDGVHPVTQKEGKTTLKAGTHHVAVEFFQGGGGAELSAEIRLPGKQVWQNLAGLITTSPDGKRPASERFRIDAALAAEGRRLFESTGCANCHELKEGERRIAATLNSPALEAVAAGKGCLAEPEVKSTSAAAASPRFVLSAVQRKALIAAVAAVRSSPKAESPPTNKQRLAHDLATFNCYACHQRDGVGGVDPNKSIDLDDDGIPDRDPTSELLSPLFVGTTPEMGDEGRLPPRLDGVGAKLTDAYLKQVLEKGSKDRPYMKTVMPNFGGGNVRHLGPLFGELDARHAETLAAADGPDYRVKAEGRLLVGTKGFGCVKCHQFNKQKAEGIQGIDMTIITRRLRPEWFVKYVRDPQSLRPGTRMPTVFPEGKSPLKDTCGGDVGKQIGAMWTFLSDGDKAAVPIGVGGQPIELIAEKEAIIYRNFIEGAGPRAVGVGYPEKVNLAFDAGDLRPALVWHGAFIDAAKHWTGRGSGFQGPLGDDVIRLAEGTAFARLADDRQPWPDADLDRPDRRFLGYRLDGNRRPTFLYSVGGVRIDDDYRPVKNGRQAGLLRKLSLSTDGTSGSLWFRAAAGRAIKPAADGWYEIDGLWRIRVQNGGNNPIVRSGKTGQELIVPVTFAGGRATIEQEFQW